MIAYSCIKVLSKHGHMGLSTYVFKYTFESTCSLLKSILSNLAGVFVLKLP